MDPFHLDPRFFPRETQAWLDLETILRTGMIPLGTKWGYRLGIVRARFANVGCLEPCDRQGRGEVTAALKRYGVDGVHFYRVQSGPFWEVLETAYGLRKQNLKSLSPQQLHPSLHPYTDSV